ncbi:hypothetical protein S245_027220, partial [Arachis hypogaea]
IQIKRRIGIENHISERRLIDYLNRIRMNESIDAGARTYLLIRSLLWNSQVALILHSGIFSDDLLFFTILHSWYHLFKIVDIRLSSCLGSGFIQCTRSQGVQYRFVLPTLSIAVIYSGYCLAMTEDPGLPGYYKGKESLKKRTNCSLKMVLAIIFLLATNIPMSLYMSLVHQRGPEDVTNHFAREASHGKVKNILFLTACHATQYYSVLHHGLPMRFLDCTPRTTLFYLIWKNKN